MQDFLQNWKKQPYIQCQRKHKRDKYIGVSQIDLPVKVQKSELDRQIKRFNIHFLQCLSHVMLQNWENRDKISFQSVKESTLKLAKIKFEQDMNDRLVKQGSSYTMQNSVPKSWRTKFKQSINKLLRANPQQLINMNKRKKRSTSSIQHIEQIQFNQTNQVENSLLPSPLINFNNFQQQNSIFMSSEQGDNNISQNIQNQKQRDQQKQIVQVSQIKTNKHDDEQLIRQSNAQSKSGISPCFSHYLLFIYIIICSICKFQWQIESKPIIYKYGSTSTRCYDKLSEQKSISSVQIGYYHTSSTLESNIKPIAPQKTVYDAVSQVIWFFG